MIANSTSLSEQLTELGRFAASCDVEALSSATRKALEAVVLDNLTVMLAGARLSESSRLRQSCPPTPHGVTVLGAADHYAIPDAAWLNGVAMVSLELDEGHKAIRGHASAHVFPIALALAESFDLSGVEFLSAFLAGHEVASRFGNATILRAGIHPHGNWGVTGAAAAAAKLLDLGPTGIARALDNATTQALATPFGAALGGMSIRNSWIGAANVLGYRAAQVAAAEDSQGSIGMAEDVFGDILGTFDTANLTANLGEPFFIETGYFKRHASCSYTHPPADASLALRERYGSTITEGIEEIVVATHHLGAPLSGTTWTSRMAAMLSIPYVVATALQEGDLAPERFDAHNRDLNSRYDLARKVKVVVDPELDQLLPQQRGARVSIRYRDGREVTETIWNPVGDADFHPFGIQELSEKSEQLLGEEAATRVLMALKRLWKAPSMRAWLDELQDLVHIDDSPLNGSLSIHTDGHD